MIYFTCAGEYLGEEASGRGVVGVGGWQEVETEDCGHLTEVLHLPGLTHQPGG